jgi:fucose permease
VAPWLIVVLALLSAVTLGNLVGATYWRHGGLGLLLVGACFGPIFPTLVGLVLQTFPDAQGVAYGTMFAVGGTSGLMLPPLIGYYARRKTVREALRIPVVLALLLAAPALVLALVLRLT